MEDPMIKTLDSLITSLGTIRQELETQHDLIKKITNVVVDHTDLISRLLKRIEELEAK